MDSILNEKALFKMEILVGTELVVTVLTDIELGAHGFQSTGGNHLKALANQGGNSSQSNNFVNHGRKDAFACQIFHKSNHIALKVSWPLQPFLPS